MQPGTIVLPYLSLLMQEHYDAATKDRKLTWHHNMGSVAIKSQFKGKVYDLTMTPIQAVVLMLFNDREHIPLDQSFIVYKLIYQSSGKIQAVVTYLWAQNCMYQLHFHICYLCRDQIDWRPYKAFPWIHKSSLSLSLQTTRDVYKAHALLQLTLLVQCHCMHFMHEQELCRLCHSLVRCWCAEDELTYADLKEQTNMPDDELMRSLHSLSCARIKVLLKVPASSRISKTDSFKYNTDFSEKARKLKVQDLSSVCCLSNAMPEGIKIPPEFCIIHPEMVS